MTDREKAIISAYTGIAMLTGDKFSIFRKYVEDILGRSVWTHELADRTIWEEIREKSKADFLALCEERQTGVWIDYDNTFYKCPECGYLLPKDCPNCQNKVILPIGGEEQ